MTIQWKAVKQYFAVLLFNFTQFAILENISIVTSDAEKYIDDFP